MLYKRTLTLAYIYCLKNLIPVVRGMVKGSYVTVVRRMCGAAVLPHSDASVCLRVCVCRALEIKVDSVASCEVLVSHELPCCSILYVYIYIYIIINHMLSHTC